MARIALLVVEAGPRLGSDGVVRALRDHAEIALVTGRPVNPADVARLLTLGITMDVVLVLGSETQVEDVAARLGDCLPDLNILTATVDIGRTSMTLHNHSVDALVQTILSVGRARRRHAAAHKVLSFRDRLLGRGAPLPDSRAPVLVETEDADPAIDPAARAVLADALDWVERATRILLEVWSARKEDVPGLATTWDSLERWLAAFVGLADSPAEDASEAFDTLARRLVGEEGRGTPLGALAALLDHDRLALQLVLIAVAGELDMRFHRLFGALHDDFSRRRPSLGLACAIIAASTPQAVPSDVRGELAVPDRIARLRLACGGAPGDQPADEPLAVPGVLVDWLLAGDAERLLDPVGFVFDAAPADEAAGCIPERRMRRLRRMVRQALVRPDDARPIAVIVGGSERGWLAAEVAGIEPGCLVVAPGQTDAPHDGIAAALAQIAIAANLANRRVVLDLRGVAASLWAVMEPMLDRFRQPPFVIVANPAQLPLSERESRFVIVDVPPPTAEDRRQAVAMALLAQGEHDTDFAGSLADRFALPPDAMPRATALALGAAVREGRAFRPTQDDWFTGFRQAAGGRLPALARRVEPQPRRPEEEGDLLDRLILPPAQRGQIEELIRHVLFGPRVLGEWGFASLLDGQGVAALFAGESGTGKTTAAHVIASHLRTDLYVIELSQVVSKYIGETEKNLDIVFDEAQAAGAVLLFDEADALFGKRSAVSSAHDRYANIEVAYLLQRLQRFAGLAILTTNNAANIDAAFARRLRFRVEFPRPAPAERLLIWEQSLPVEHRAGDLDLRRLAVGIDVTGGVIRQMAFHAAVLAAEADRRIVFADVVAGVRSQLVRLGRFDDLGRLDAIATSPERKVA